jgi:endoglucanase
VREHKNILNVIKRKGAKVLNRREFIGTAVGIAAAVPFTNRGAAGGPLNPNHEKKKILQASGLKFVEGDRPVKLRGINLGGWMLIEDYMIGLPWTEWKIREQFLRVLGEESASAFLDAWAESYVTEKDMEFLARRGFNFVRLPLNYRQFESDLEPGKWIEKGFRLFDRAVNLCRKVGLRILPDLHAAPGAQARDQNAGSAYGETYLWNHRDFMDRTARLWGEIARRYSDDPTVLGYNILCEPVVSDIALLNDFYLSAIRAIRRHDSSHMIVLDSNLWAKDVSSLRDPLFEDPQVIPALHHYYFDDPFFPRLTTYPGKVDARTCDRAVLERTLDGKHDQKRIPRPVLVAEFGITRAHPQPYDVQLAIGRDLVSIFEEKGWGWAMWCYKDIRHMGILTPRPDTPWRRFLESEPVAGFFKRYAEIEEPFTAAVGRLLADTDIETDIREQWAREVRRDFDPPALDFILRRLRDRTPYELSEMARSFAFASCDVHEDQIRMMAPFIS